MRVDLLLPKLRAKGVVLAAKGSKLAVRRGWAFISNDERAWLRANRSVVIAAVSHHDRSDPTLRSLLQRWHTVVGQSNAHFLWALHRVTGCDFDERNPTAEEIRVFDEILNQLTSGRIQRAPDKPAEHGRHASLTTNKHRAETQETFA